MILFLNFSDWIILWFILYVFKIVNHNPIFVVLFSLIVNLIFIIKLTFEKSYIHIANTIHIIIKILMTIYLLTKSSFNITDLITGLFIFILYNIWLYKVHNLKFLDLINKNLDYNRKYNINLELNDINQININKINDINNNYIKNIDELNKKYKNKLNKSGFKIDEKKIDDIIKKYKNKLNKLNSYLNNNLVTLFNELC